MATYYFDSISGSDSNNGSSWGAAFKGSTKQIKDYIASGNVVWLKGSWNNQIGGTFNGLSSFELRVDPAGATLDCRTRHNSGWTNVSSSKVWKKSYANQVHRLFLGNGNIHGFIEGSDVGKRYLVTTSGSWATTAATDNQVVTVLDAGSVNQSRFWYWDGVSGYLYVRSTNNSTDPDTAYGGVWTTDGADYVFADRRRWMPFEFVSCPSLFFGAVEIRGATKPLIVSDCSGTIEPYLTDFQHYQWPALTTIGGNGSGNRRNLTINNPKILMRRPLFSDDINQTNFDDGNKVRDQGGADCITVEQYWNQWKMYGGTIEAGVHGAVTSQWYHGAYITSGLIRGTYIDQRNMRYARAFNLQSTATNAITAFTIERVTVEGQPINSQVNWDNTTIQNCVWRNGRFGWFGDGSTAAYIDKYNPSQNYASRWRNSHSLSLTYVDGVAASNMTIDSNIFYGQYDAPIDYESTTNTSIVVSNNWFIRNAAIAGGQYGDYILFNDTWPVNYGTKTVTWTSNKHAGGYNYVPTGVTAMSSTEQSLYTARAQVTSFAFAPTSGTPAVSGSQSVTVTALDRNGAAVSGFSGTVSTSADAGIATASAPTALTDVSGNVTWPVNGVSAGSTTIELRAIQGAALANYAVSPGGVVTGIRVVQSAIDTTLGGATVAVTLSGVTAGNTIVAVVGGYWDDATGVSMSDDQSPPGAWAARVGQFHTGGSSTSIGIFAQSTTVATGTTNITVTATPTKSPAATNAYITLVLLEVTGVGSFGATGSAIGMSATPTVNLAPIAAPALVIAGAAQSGVGAPTIAATNGYAMQRVKNDQAGIGVATLKINVDGDYDPAFLLTSTSGDWPSSQIEWPAIALVLQQSSTPTPPAGTAPTVTTSSLPAGTVGTSYNQTLAATGSTPITWSITSGALPSGLALNASTGAITGTPLLAGTLSFSAKATNASGSDTKALSIGVSGSAPTITTLSLNAAVKGTAFSQILIGTGSSPLTWTVTGGALPTGVTLSTGGVLSGTPTVSGTFSVTITVTNSYGNASRTYSWTVTEVAPGGGSIVATPSSVTVSISSGPVSVVITDGNGNPLSGSPDLAARVDISRPAFVLAPKYIVSGKLTLAPVAVGSSTITIVYGDQIDDERTTTIPVTVTP